MHYHSLSIEQTLNDLNTNAKAGLSTKEVKKRQQQHGPNALLTAKRKSIVLRFFAQFKDFMILVLIAAAAISFFVSYLEGETDLVDPLIILAIIVLNAVLGLIQEEKAEKSLESLKQLSAPNALVLRDGKKITIPSHELVPGDIIFLETGHFVPADARVLTSVNLRIDESALTGESHPVEKEAGPILAEDTMLGDRKNMVPSTGIVTFGRGTGVVTAIGMQTEVGHIAKLILEDKTPDTPLQKRLAKTGQMLGIAALGICIIIFIIGALQGRPLFTMFMTSVSLAVAAIPEGLPAVVTIMLSLGVQRMAKKNTVIRKLPAVETLGSATYICSDKTGTLTQNIMTVTTIALPDGREIKVAYDQPAPRIKAASYDSSKITLMTAALLCNNATLNTEESSKKTSPFLGKSISKEMRNDTKVSRLYGNGLSITGEATEKALLSAAILSGCSYQYTLDTYKRVRELPFDSTKKRMTTVHKQMDNSYLAITKGAFDLLLSHCTYINIDNKREPITDAIRNKLKRQNDRMTSQALRVIAIAQKTITKNPVVMTSDELEEGLTFLGMLGMIDPPRLEVKDAVITCQRAGITPVMITGDHIATACAIANDLGILKTNATNGRHAQAITGEELNRLSQSELEENIYQYRVFARVSPEHKVRIVKALQKRGEIVAMTGDGVNDAPALKAADIGCSMGKTGTDVAKNASDMILLDDNFATIVAAVKEGRGIYDNIKKSVHFLLSSNIGEIITIFTAILLKLPSPLAAVQLLWVNLVTDSLPAIALGVEAPDPDIMDRKPISSKKGMFADGLIFKILSEGLMIGILSLIAYFIGGTTMTFAVLGLSQLFHAFNMRSRHSLKVIGVFTNKKMVLSFVVCAFLQIIVISVAPLAHVFQVVPLSFLQWIIVFILSFLPIPIIELQKASTNRYK